MHFGCLGVVFGWGGFIIAWIINSLAEGQAHYYVAVEKYWNIAKTITFILFLFVPAFGLFLAIQMFFAWVILFGKK